MTRLKGKRSVFWPIPARCQTSRPCLPVNRLISPSSCLHRISDALFDDNQFFFGKSLDAVCNNTAQNNPDDVNCFVGDENTRKYTIASRLFPEGIDAGAIDRLLTVTYETSAGTYNACGGTYTAKARTTDVNPDMASTEPVYLRIKPAFELRTDPNTYYTIIVVDATYGFVHGLFIDYPEIKDIIAYRPPYTFRNITNTFMFFVYKQTEKDYMLEPMVLMSLKNQGVGKLLTLDKFAADHALTGPIAVNWMQVKRDSWSVQHVATSEEKPGGADYCITLIADAFRLLNLPFGSKDFATIDTVLKVTFTSSPFTVATCCQNASSGLSASDISPLADQVFNASTFRNRPFITLEKTVVRWKNDERKYTLLLADPAFPDATLATPSRPFINWLYTNFDEMSTVDLANVKLSYVEPFSLPQSARRLYFLLYEQTLSSDVETTDFGNKSDACPLKYTGRCRFDVEAFVKANQLVLRAATWLTVQSDLYSLCAMNQTAVCVALQTIPKLSTTPTTKKIREVTSAPPANAATTIAVRCIRGNLTFSDTDFDRSEALRVELRCDNTLKCRRILGQAHEWILHHPFQTLAETSADVVNVVCDARNGLTVSTSDPEESEALILVFITAGSLSCRLIFVDFLKNLATLG
ncbi:uncharacterized protein LOC129590718 isoform X2 [Paramacrobiotus metropolitanus]|uniref:uncharacterized protein LOC129590718 isoform X2 n=1 Tax=Paramacrobiotus metropolitanus TaxID=2943436 RepID=UPI002445F77D|nr:uncharacterized protein LOC129590718 isoform X2 [Paramacrobiotus metropolitanus]XP_055342051.1 uncharacterized protein LOC129590718 isoform X2 [Paramacrobiotus metropolitanus]